MKNTTNKERSSEIFDWLIGRTIRSFGFVYIVNGEVRGANLTGKRASFIEGKVTGFQKNGWLECKITKIVARGCDATDNPGIGAAARGGIQKVPLFWDSQHCGHGFHSDNRLEFGSIQIIG
jgi:hypothetical protein